ncbi:MAG: FAD-binding protein [Marinilabiliales bacterium]|nr:FAD-binding protein [Marinilabiliales bacterium]
MYATDGSAYRELPVAVARPKDKEDVRHLYFVCYIKWDIPYSEGAGTSLAGQVVGLGIAVDVSKYMNSILEFNPSERWIVVEPGVILSRVEPVPHRQ